MTWVRPVLAVTSLALVAAHSWMECVDWRFNNQAAYNDVTLQRFDASSGKCYGYARRWPLEKKEFGKYDEIWRYRNNKLSYTSTSPPCRAEVSGQGGSIETRTSPISAAYAPNRDGAWPAGEDIEYGPMTTGVKPGQKLCFTWPGKNHAGLGLGTNPTHVQDDNMVFISLAPSEAEPNQATLDQNVIGQIPYRRCTPGRASDGDQTGVGSELAACGGCVTIPQRTPGTYMLQWRQSLNGVQETYTSCADIQIVAAAPTSPTVPPPTPPPTTAAPGPAPGSQVVFDDSLKNGWKDYSWASPRNFAATAQVARGTNSISWSVNNWAGLYFFQEGATLQVSNFQQASFWLYYASGTPQLSFALTSAATSSGSTVLAQREITMQGAGQWYRYTVNLAGLAGSSAQFKGFWLQGWNANDQGTMYVDDVSLDTVAGQPPVGASQTPPNTAVTFTIVVRGLTTANAATLTGNGYAAFEVYLSTLVNADGRFQVDSHRVTPGTGGLSDVTFTVTITKIPSRTVNGTTVLVGAPAQTLMAEVLGRLDDANDPVLLGGQVDVSGSQIVSQGVSAAPRVSGVFPAAVALVLALALRH